MKTFVIKTLGCKTNQIESAIISEKMQNAGYKEQSSIDADIYILNSCSVTSVAESKAISYLKSAKKNNPNIITVLTGCFAQLNAEKLQDNPLIDIIVGNYEKTDIPELLEKHEKIFVSDIFSHKDFRHEFLKNTSKTRAILKIQDGCNNRCAYCTIPFARGVNRSNSVQNILDEINILKKSGYEEIVLTGIHIGQWGHDFEEKQTIINLLKEIEKTTITRYRLGSLNPVELNDELIDFLSASKKFCPHFHLSLQSICDKTLSNMNRNYSSDSVMNLINKINNKFDNAFIGSDIIVGFPNESEEDFEITYNNLKASDVSKIHVFPYSRRKNTVADKMSNQVSECVKKQRVAKIMKLSEEKYLNFMKKNLNTKNWIIVEKHRDKKTNFLKGMTDNYINVLIDDDDKYKNKLVKIKIIKISDDNSKCHAKIVT